MSFHLVKNSGTVASTLLGNKVSKLNVIEPKALVSLMAQCPDTFAVEIQKQNPVILDRSVWVGHKMGGMTTWLGNTLYQLPYTKFYLFLDSAAVQDPTILDYYDTFYRSAFYKHYQGLCLGTRSALPSAHLHSIHAIKAHDLHATVARKARTYLVDVRSAEQSRSKPVVHIPPGVEYCNLPLDSEELSQRFCQTFRQLGPEEQIITMCARGYRATIAYSLFRHLVKPWNWDKMHACQSTTDEINACLASAARGHH